MAVISPGRGQQAPERVQLHCMEIWGGIGPRDSAICVPGMDAWVFSQPAAGSGVGGDIHYLSTCGSGRISRFAVADVSGHGESAADFARVLRSLIRRHINTLDQARFARRLNEAFTARSADGAFATAILATYFTPTDHLVLVNAGHPAPLWYRRADAAWQFLRPDLPGCEERVSNLPLGVIRPTAYRQFAVRLAPGDLVAIYTDALTEAADPRGHQLGEQGLLGLVAGLDPADPPVFRRQLLERIDAWRGHRPSADDTTLLLLQHNGANPPWPGLRDTVRNLGKLVGLVPY